MENLGRWFSHKGIVFDKIYCDDDQSSKNSFLYFLQGYGDTPKSMEFLPCLSRHDFEQEVLDHLHQFDLKSFNIALREKLKRWALSQESEGAHAIASPHQTWDQFSDLAADRWALLQNCNCSGNILMIGSALSVAILLGHVLFTPPETVVELALQLHPAGLSECHFNERNIRLSAFNLNHFNSPTIG